MSEDARPLDLLECEGNELIAAIIELVGAGDVLEAGPHLALDEELLQLATAAGAPS